jgi:LytS/YehU family sensor histidine kinase
VPTLSIATVIENAVNHGASKLEKGGNIILSTYKNNKNYIINISNDGEPYAGQPMGVGLTSCIERIKTLQNGTFTITPRSTNGTIVIIEIPMEEI